MNVIENDVRALVDKELTAANERFPQFHSAHEGGSGKRKPPLTGRNLQISRPGFSMRGPT